MESACKIKQKFIETDEQLKQQFYGSLSCRPEEIQEMEVENDNGEEVFLELNESFEPLEEEEEILLKMDTDEPINDEIQSHSTVGSPVQINCTKKTCYYCFQEFNTQKSMFDHMNIEHKTDYGFCCSVDSCAYENVSTAKTMHAHLSSHYNPDNLVCNICGKVLGNDHTFKIHQKIHTDRNRLACDLCGITVIDKSKLMRHFRVVHLKVKKHVCQVCCKAFKEAHLLKSHQIRHHGEVGKYKCTVCKSSFVQKYKFLKHLETHEETFLCDLCPEESFKNTFDLQKHVEMVHNRKESKYQCEFCKKKFFKKHNLTCHQR